MALSAGVCLSCWLALMLTAHAASSRPASDAPQKIAQVESCLPPPVLIKGDQPVCKTLANRMAELHIPAVSIAVVHGGVIEWARGYGVRESGGGAVTAETIFQAGSISKPVAALAALHLVEAGKLSLDANVNAALTSWKVPPSASAPGATVTLRELLTHTAGFTVHGFPGYAAGAPVPALRQVLNGEAPANTPAIRLESVPGSKWNYSGGGFTVMQQLLIDAAHEPFPELLRTTVLAPIGMSHSTYRQPLTADLRVIAAMPYDDHGKPIPGGPHTYPEMAAAGLWTTPSDLARYLIEIQQSLAGRANHVLSQNFTRQMLTAGKGNWGLGVEIGGSPTDPYFTHGGVNEGYESLFVAYEKSGDGAAVMTNAQGGTRLASEVMSSIAEAYGWPDFRPVTRTAIRLDHASLARFVGSYQLAPEFSIRFMLEGDQLMTQAGNEPQVPVYPESQNKFFLKVVDAEVEFFFDSKGEASYLILHQNGREMRGVKK